MAGQDDLNESIEVAAKVVEESPQQKDEILLSNGVRLRAKSVPIMTLRYATVSIPKPEPPVVYDEEKGRSEKWEGDPRYIQQVEEWENKVSDASTNVMLMMGTEVIHIPEGIERPEDTGWVEMLEATGMQPKIDTTPARYLSWLRFYALATANDLKEVAEAIARKSGVLEADVQASVESFRRRENGRADSESTSEERRGDGDNVQGSDSGSYLGG